MERSETLLEALDRAAASSRGLRFVDRREREQWLPYTELEERAAEVCGGLQQLGIEAGDTVALIFPTSPEFCAALFGCVMAGAHPVALYPPVRLGRLDEYHRATAKMLKDSRARVVLASDRVRRLLGRSVAEAWPPLGCLTIDKLPSGERRPVEVQPRDIALFQFTSGTTGHPRPVSLTHRQILSNACTIGDTYRAAYPESDGLTHVCVSWLPMYHDMALIGCLMVSIAHPIDLVLIPPENFLLRPALWLRAVSRYRGTLSPAPNFSYSYCVERIKPEELADVDLSSWKVAFNGGEAVTAATVRRFIERFRPYGLAEETLTPVYGLAEATLAVTFSDLALPFRAVAFDEGSLVLEGVARPAPGGRELVSVGRPLPETHVKIVGDDGALLDEDRVGRIHARSPSIMEGYFGHPAETDAVLRDGWLDTGDEGFFHGGGLFVCGRSKDVIIVRGRNYSPDPIERALDGLEGARSGCAVAVSLEAQDAATETLLLLVERERQADPNDDGQLAAAVGQRVSSAVGLVPDVVILEPGTLPRTSSGKLRRRDAKDRYVAGTLTPPKPASAVRLAGEMARSSLAFLGMKRRKPDDREDES